MTAECEAFIGRCDEPPAAGNLSEVGNHRLF